MSGAPLYRHALLETGGAASGLPPRRLSRILGLSLLLHAGLLAWLLMLTLFDFGPVPPPPMTVRFFAAAPPAPRLVPLRERQEAKPPQREALSDPSPVPPIRTLPIEARPAPPAIRVEPDPLPIKVADRAPELAIHDLAPPAPTATAPRIAPLGSTAVPQTGTGAEPELEFLVPGKDRARGTGGGLAGRDLVPTPPAGDPAGSWRRGGAGGGPGGSGGPGGGAALETEGAFTGSGLAAFLGRKYGVTLTEASRLGSRTSDGASYALLLPALSEAYRAVPFRGRRRGGADSTVESVQADADAIAIRYRDGTVHVLAPTTDGLVALFVSSQAGSRTKLQEAERALNVLLRMSSESRGGRTG